MAETLRQPVTPERMQTFMEGRDPEKYIVNLDYNYNDDYITVIKRDENDNKLKVKHPFYPFLWCTLNACKRLCFGKKDEVKALLKKYGIKCIGLDYTNNDGKVVESVRDGYAYMFKATRPMSQRDFLQFFKDAKNPVYSDSKDDSMIDSSKSSQYLMCTPQEQFLISTGKRFFKGYDDYNQLLRCVFDLETEGLDQERHRITHIGIRFNRPVTYKGVTKEYVKLVELQGSTEAEKNRSELNMICFFLKCASALKPDVIGGHNSEVFDWNFLMIRCRKLGQDFGKLSERYFGEGRSIYKKKRETVLKLGGEVEHFYQTVVPDTTVVDSMHAARRAQATDSKFKEHNLKYATIYLKMVKPNRVYVPGDKINKISEDFEEHYAFNEANGHWYVYDPSAPALSSYRKGKGKEFKMTTRPVIEDGYRLVSGHYIVERYLEDDIWEGDKVEYALNGTDFMLCKIVPTTFQKAVTMGTAGQWKLIMMAWSYENGLAIPKPENTGKFTGGLSRLIRTGFVRNIAKFDYNSLYPSIILTWAINDETDLQGSMLYMLEYVLTTREKHKKLKKKAGKIVEKYRERIRNGEILTPEEEKDYEAAQNTFKIEDNRQAVVKKLGNSFFGSFGTKICSVFPWKSKKCAERTTCTGRQALRLMISHFSTISTFRSGVDGDSMKTDHNGVDLGSDYNYQPIVGDTDGFNFEIARRFRYYKVEKDGVVVEDRPYIGRGLSRETVAGKKYYDHEADVAEFNDLFMGRTYGEKSVCKMGLGIDEIVTNSVNVSRKNYFDYFDWEPEGEDIKLVGNSLQSRRSETYISRFLEDGIRLLAKGDGNGGAFLDLYYDTVEKVYNYRIPLKDLASKGRVKRRVADYKEDCKQLTKAGRPKSRQAWMELCIKEGLNPEIGETIYYINTGARKGDSDIKKITHYYKANQFGDVFDMAATVERQYKKYKSEMTAMKREPEAKTEWIMKNFPDIKIEDEIIFNSKLVPASVIESDEDLMCAEGEEYNVEKYIEKLNNKVKPLLVCFSRDIRDSILIRTPMERPYFTKEETMLVSGEPNKPGDQDTYEDLMKMEDKEIKFWLEHPEYEIPYLHECGMVWEEIKSDYLSRMQKEKELGIDIIRKEYENALDEITIDEIDAFLEEGKLPVRLGKIVDIDAESNKLLSKQFPDIALGTLNDIIDKIEDIVD